MDQYADLGYKDDLVFGHPHQIISSIANVATRYILDKAAVAGVIIGVRLGISDYSSSNAQVFNFNLDKSDYNDIDAICTKSNNLFETIGDCGDEYR